MLFFNGDPDFLKIKHEDKIKNQNKDTECSLLSWLPVLAPVLIQLCADIYIPSINITGVTSFSLGSLSPTTFSPCGRLVSFSTAASVYHTTYANSRLRTVIPRVDASCLNPLANFSLFILFSRHPSSSPSCQPSTEEQPVIRLHFRHPLSSCSQWCYYAVRGFIDTSPVPIFAQKAVSFHRTTRCLPLLH